MKDVCIAIPSKGRHLLILEKTLNLLSEVDTDIFIFVDKNDFNNYQLLTQTGKDIQVIQISDDIDNISSTRKYIQKYLDKRYKYVWVLDDNLDVFQVRNGYTASGKIYHLTNLNKTEIRIMFDEVLDIMKKNNYIQGTLSFRPSNWYCDSDIKENTRAWGIVLNDNETMLKNEILYDDNCPVFEDYDITAQCIKKGFKTFSSFKYDFHKSMGKYQGGCQTYRTPEMTNKVCKYLSNKYPGIVEIELEEKRQMYEPLFNWKKLEVNKKQSRLF